MTGGDRFGGTMRRLFLLLAMLASSLAISQVAHGEILISAEEAARPVHPSVKGPTIIVKSAVRKPTVEIDSRTLQGTPLKSPLNFIVKFTPHGGTKVDPQSVQVTYLRTPEIDLTPRLQKYISASGIDLKSAEVPPGEHFLRVSLKDTGGTENSVVIQLIVSPAVKP